MIESIIQNEALRGAIVGGILTSVGAVYAISAQNKKTDFTNMIFQLDTAVERYRINRDKRIFSQDKQEIERLRYEAGHMIYNIFLIIKNIKKRHNMSDYRLQYAGLMKEIFTEFCNVNDKGARIIIKDYTLLEDVYKYITNEELENGIIDYVKEFSIERN